MARPKEVLDQEIEEILQGRSFYGSCEIKEKEVSPGVVWVGSNGVTSSVGQWVRVVKRELQRSSLRWLYRWFCATNPGGSQNMWYFGADVGDTFYCCGGCTDFSGEGGHGKELGDRFLEMIGFPITTNPADHLISLLIEGVPWK